jgi:hypothetical protein
MEDLTQMIDDTRIRKNIYDTIIVKLSKIKYTDSNSKKWKLTMINNSYFVDTPQQQDNVYNGLKVIFVSEDFNLYNMCNLSDEQLNNMYISHFKNLNSMQYSNFISNINSGKITSYDDLIFSPFDGYDYFKINSDFQKQLVHKHSTFDYNKQLDGVINDLINYNYICPFEWTEPGKTTITQSEYNTCKNIAQRINNNDNPVLQKLTSIPKTQCNDGSRCIDRIEKLAEILDTNVLETDEQAEDSEDEDI